jgi:hypothetical protein
MKILTWERMNAAVDTVHTYLFFSVLCVLIEHKHNCFLAVSVISITSIQNYYHSLLSPTLVLPVLLTFSDGRILMWEGSQLASVYTGYLFGWYECCGRDAW